MKDETKVWLDYASENLAAAKVLLEQHLYNPCLQNGQQSIEKALKAILLEKDHTLSKTHSIAELRRLVSAHQIGISLSEEDCELFDAIYLPSKYPLGGVLPNFEPDETLCRDCLVIIERVVHEVVIAVKG